MSSDLIVEEWRPINGYDNYMVSNLGQVKNTKTGKLLKPHLERGCYILCSKGVKTKEPIHQLVEEAFPSLEEREKIMSAPILAEANRACVKKQYRGPCKLT